MKIRDFSELVLLTTKVSDGNMSFFKEKKEVLKNRKKFAEKFGLNLDNFVVLYLQHKDKVYSATIKDLGRGAKDTKTVIKADAAVTNRRGVYLSILTADCLPICIYDPKTKAISIVHVSRHNIYKIIKNTINKLKKEFNIFPRNLIVNVGPSIGSCHFEIDLWKIAEEELKVLGVFEKNINNQRICTFESPDYFSQRKAKSQNLPDNRFATIFGIRICSQDPENMIYSKRINSKFKILNPK